MTKLETRILEVATWILKVNPHFEHNYFRSEEIRSIGTNNAHLDNRYPLVNADAIIATASKRSMLLKERDIPLISLEEAVAGGSLIYTIPAESQLDGGAEFQSRGLVDIWEVPAWDTWVAFGPKEFKEFSQYPDAVISWIPKTVDNLFFSGQALSIINNLGWLKLDVSNLFLMSLAKEPENLEFIEIADEDRSEIFRRLQIINGEEEKEIRNEKKAENDVVGKNTLTKPVVDGFLGRIKNLFK